jgi:hypothetical protein
VVLHNHNDTIAWHDMASGDFFKCIWTEEFLNPAARVKIRSKDYTVGSNFGPKSAPPCHTHGGATSQVDNKESSRTPSGRSQNYFVKTLKLFHDPLIWRPFKIWKKHVTVLQSTSTEQTIVPSLDPQTNGWAILWRKLTATVLLKQRIREKTWDLWSIEY